VAALDGDLQHALRRPRGRVRVGAEPEQQPRHLEVAGRDGVQERRVAELVHGVDRYPGLREEADAVGQPLDGAEVEGRLVMEAPGAEELGVLAQQPRRRQRIPDGQVDELLEELPIRGRIARRRPREEEEQEPDPQERQ
jgi:hypothetical protein